MNWKYWSQKFFLIWQYSFYPFFVLSALGICMFLIRTINTSYLQLIPLITTGIFLFPMILFETLMPYRKAWLGNNADVITDTIQTFLVLPLASVFAQYLLSSIKPHYNMDTFLIELLPFQGSILLAIKFVLFLLLSDFFYYWVHRASHRFNLLWRFHSVHHGALRVYSINSGRFHFIEAIFSSAAYFLPMFFLGASDELFILVVTMSLITGFLEHINVDFKGGVLNYVFNTAELHRWHHSKIIVESNRNFGKVLSVWDICFGTFFLPKNKDVKEVGVENEIISNVFFEQLIHPFKKPS